MVSILHKELESEAELKHIKLEVAQPKNRSKFEFSARELIDHTG